MRLNKYYFTKYWLNVNRFSKTGCLRVLSTPENPSKIPKNGMSHNKKGIQKVPPFL
jgi:hypothetical protein